MKTTHFQKLFDQTQQEALSIVMKAPILNEFEHLNKRQLQEFALGFFHFVKLSPKYFTSLLARSPNDIMRLTLIDNIIDEMGGVNNIQESDSSDTHPNLYRRFAYELGLSDRELGHIDGVKPYAKRMYGNFCRVAFDSPFWRSLGGLSPGIENVFDQWIGKIYKGLLARKKFSPGALVYFDIHAALDHIHGEKFRECILKTLTTEEDFAQLRDGALTVARIHRKFLDDFAQSVHSELPAPCLSAFTAENLSEPSSLTR
jgi:pyrroloquinoline quinone (PQQ) biosynthesis protein C